MTQLCYSDTLTTGPTGEPVTPTEVRRNLDLDDNSWDADIVRWITQARRRVEHDARRALFNQTRTRKLNEWPAGNFIELDTVAPLSSVTSVSYVDTAGDSQTWSSSNYSVDTSRVPGGIRMAYNGVWPALRDYEDVVTIVYVVGYGTAASSVPAEAISAMHLLIRHWYDNPELVIQGQQRTALPNPEAYDACINQLSWGAYP